jgi:uncharacterized protein (TIGR03032 family)
VSTYSQQLFVSVPRPDDGFLEYLEQNDVTVVALVGDALVFLGRHDNGDVAVEQHHLQDCRGLLVDGETLWVVSGAFLWSYQRPDIDGWDENQVRRFFPQWGITLGDLGVCGLVPTSGTPLVLSATFDCLARVDDHFSMVPLWTPSKTGELGIHVGPRLSGVTLLNHRVIATALGPKGSAGDGYLMDHDATILLGNLRSPFAPHVVGEDIIMGEADTGKILRVNAKSGDAQVLAEFVGVLSSLAVCHAAILVGQGSPERGYFTVPGSTKSASASDGETISLLNLHDGSLIGSVVFEGQSGPIRALGAIEGSRHASLELPHSRATRETVILREN